MTSTWDAILAMEIAGLNMAIEEQCYGRHWQVVTHMKTAPSNYCPTAQEIYEPAGIWILREDDPMAVTGSWGRGKMPYDHTASWEDCMPLAWHYGIDLLIHRRAASSLGSVGHLPSQTVLRHLATEAEARVAVCRVALWCAQEGQL